MSGSACYLGTDVGGTFTDFVLYTSTGEMHCIKTPSTPAEPGASALAGIDELKQMLPLPEAAWRHMIHTHSSTVATNALIEQVRSALNLPTGSMPHHPFLSLALTNFVVTHTEGIHINAGILRCIDLVLPKASVVNASFPAACGMRYTTAMRVHELILGAMTQALPGGVPASGASSLVVTYVSTSELGETGRVIVANPVSGGSGGGPDQDGISGTDLTVAFLRNLPVEILESEAPVRVRRFGLTSDSEGAGKFRGGFGVEYELEIRHPSAVVVMRGKDRHRYCAWGAAGGGAGGTGGNFGMRRNEAPHDIGKRTVYRPELGEVIRIWSGGGGGFGDPLERDPALVAADVDAGLVSPGRARDVYGVIITNGRIDVAATGTMRERLTDARGQLPEFDLGIARTLWERDHAAAAERIAAWLPGLAAGVRRYAQSRVYRVLHASGAGPYSASAIAVAIAEVEQALEGDRPSRH